MQDIIKHPSYDIYVRSANCNYEIYINDVLVFINLSNPIELGTGTGVDIPMNTTILKNGQHKIKARVLPRIGMKNIDNYCFLELEFLLANTDKIYIPKNQRKEDIELLKIQTPWKKLEKNINLPFFDLEGEFEATMLPFELVGWTKSANLKDEDEKQLFKEVIAYYQELHAILKKRDAVKWEKLHEEKEALISKAFYYDYHVNEKKDPAYTAMVKGRKNATAELFKEDGLDLVPLVASELKLLIQAEGRLVSLVRSDNTPALRFNDPKNEGEVEFEMRLHRKQKGSKMSII